MDEQSRSIGSYVRGAGRSVKHGAGSAVDTVYGAAASVTGTLVTLSGLAGAVHPGTVHRKSALGAAAVGLSMTAAGHRLWNRNRDIRRAREEGRNGL